MYSNIVEIPGTTRVSVIFGFLSVSPLLHCYHSTIASPHFNVISIFHTTRRDP